MIFRDSLKITDRTDILKQSPKHPTQKTWLKQVLKPLRGTKHQLFTLSLAVNLLSLTVPIFVLQVYDRVIFHNGLTTLQGLMIGMLIVLLFEFLLRRARTRILQHSGVAINQQLGQSLFEKVLSLPLRQLESQPSAHWQMLFRDMDAVRNRHAGPSAMLLYDLPFTLMALALVITIAAPIAWVLLMIIPVFLFIALRSGANIKKRSVEEREETIQRDQLITEFSTGRNSVKSLMLDRHFSKQWDQQQQQWSDSTLQRSSTTDRYRDLGQSMSMMTTLLLTSVGAIAILDQQLTLGALIATNMLSGKIIAPLSQLTSHWNQLTQYKTAKRHLDELFAQASETPSSIIAPQTVEGTLSFQQLSFGYQAEQPLIEGLNGQIGPNGIHAIVGPNGSGKSTLLKLLAGLYTPDHGQVLLDSADIHQYSREDMSRWIGSLPQQVTTFATTIHQNITFRQPDATDEMVIEACQLAGAYEFISKLDEGFATPMEESGHRFSSGECKRIAIAALFLNKPSVLLLDEPTSDLDMEAEKALAATLKQLSSDHTIILVTHSPLLLRVSDSVMLMQQGKIRAAGATSSMLEKLGLTS